MPQRKETQPANGKEGFSRRKALAIVGLSGIGLASGAGTLAAATFSRQGEPDAAAGRKKSSGSRLYASVAEMRQDTSLKEGMLAATAGFYEPGDGGGAGYLIVQETAQTEEWIISLDNGLSAQLADLNSVNYKIFGAIGDGRHDDGVQIKAAHNYANRKGLPVINLKGEFWIGETTLIPVQGNVQWGHTVFHIDERHNTRKDARFVIQSPERGQAISLDQESRAAFLSRLKPGVTFIPELAPYKNCLVVVADEEDRIGFRSTRPGQSWAKEELFYVEEHGRILGDIAWEFSNYTRLTAYPCGENYLIVEGGTFYVSGDNPGETYNGYWKGGIAILRSRTIVRNQWVGLEKGRTDTSLTPRSGFYSLSNVYDVTLEDIRLIPWEQNRDGEDRDIPAGTYGISAARILNGTFRRLTAEGSGVHWGVFGTNLNKNFRIEQCMLNRVDVHFHCWNLSIKDSLIGYKGISVTGGGELLIENTTCRSSSFINFRRDFGSRWDGNIRIRNCRFAPFADWETSILNFNPEDFDYKYPVGFGRTILVEDMIVDYSAFPGSRKPCWLMKLPGFSRIKDGPSLFFPSHLEFRNIGVQGREPGLRLMQIPDISGYRTDRRGAYDGVRMNPNACFIFDRVRLEEVGAEAPGSLENLHILIASGRGKAPEDAFSLYPEIVFRACTGLAGYFGDIAAKIKFEECSIARLSAGDAEPLKGSLSFAECLFAPEVKDDGSPFFELGSALGTRFTNCTVHAPRIGGALQPGQTDRLGFVQLNKTVRYYHLNTSLGRDILDYCRSMGIVLKPAFIAMLKSHHELETENV